MPSENCPFCSKTNSLPETSDQSDDWPFKITESDLKPLLTDKAVAHLLNIAVDLLNQGRTTQPENFPPFIKVGDCIRYRIVDVISWLELNTQGGDSWQS